MSAYTRSIALVCAACVAVSGYVFSARSTKNLQEVDPRLQAVATCALEHTSVDFVVIDGGRTAAEHANNVRNGKSWIRRSKHQDGLAIDIAAYVNGKITYEAKYYTQISYAFFYCSDKLNIPIIWGGSWKKRDLMHYELE